MDFSDYENIELFVNTQRIMEKTEKCRIGAGKSNNWLISNIFELQ